MKLGKEEYQKMFLGVLLLLTLLYGYFEMLLAPLSLSKKRMQGEITAISKQIADARNQVRRTQDAEAAVPASERVVKQVRAMIPEGAPVAWFPTYVTEHFKRQGVDRATTRFTSEQPEKDLAGFRRMLWNVEFPAIEVLPFAEAIAAFENEEPLVEITTMQIDAGGGAEPGGGAGQVDLQRAVVNMRNLVTQ